MKNSLKELSTVFKALGDRNRLRIVKMLQERPLCVCEIREVLGISQPAVSRHLAILKAAGLVKDQKREIWTDCRLAGGGEGGCVSALLEYLKPRGNEDPLAAADRRKASRADRRTICARESRQRKSRGGK